MREHHHITGRLVVEARDAATGALVLVRRAPNLVTTEGRRFLARLMTGQASVAAGGVFVALGTGNAAPKESDAALGDQAALVPAQAGPPGPGAEAGRIAVPFAATLDPNRAGTLALCEAGLVFRPAAGGGADVLYNRVVFEPVGWTDRLTLTLGWEVTF